MHPNAQISARSPATSAGPCSGDMYAAMPRIPRLHHRRTGRSRSGGRDIQCQRDRGFCAGQSQIPDHFHQASIFLFAAQITVDDALFVRGFQGYGNLSRDLAAPPQSGSAPPPSDRRASALRRASCASARTAASPAPVNVCAPFSPSICAMFRSSALPACALPARSAPGAQRRTQRRRGAP